MVLPPTEKPVPLLEFLIKSYSKENDIVLDCTCGSVSTAIASLKTNRKYIIGDNNENAIQISKNRIDYYLKNKKNIHDKYIK